MKYCDCEYGKCEGREANRCVFKFGDQAQANLKELEAAGWLVVNADGTEHLSGAIDTLEETLEALAALLGVQK